MCVHTHFPCWLFTSVYSHFLLLLTVEELEKGVVRGGRGRKEGVSVEWKTKGPWMRSTVGQEGW